MKSARARPVVLSAGLLCLSTVVAAALAFWPALVEEYWLLKLKGGGHAESERAAGKLAELESTKLVSFLLEEYELREYRRMHSKLGPYAVPQLLAVMVQHRDTRPRTTWCGTCLWGSMHYRASSILHDMGPKALPALESAARDGDDRTRAEAVEVLRALRSR